MTYGRRFVRLFGMAACAALLAGCSTILAVDEQHEKMDATAVIGGTVRTYAGRPRGPLVVGIVTRGQSGYELVDHFVSERGGSWVIAVEPGTYSVVAFEDVNGNGRYDDEPAWRPDDDDALAVAAGEHRKNLDIVIPASGRFRRTGFSLEELQARGREQQQVHSLFALSAIGEQVTLDDARFDEAVASSGMWKPYDFLLEARPGIYLLEPYDDERIPVLFVHGIGGTPINFRALIDSLDRSRFQAWVAYYPSGARLDGLARWMTQVFVRLRTRYRFDRAAVVAHSMGGLVARAFLLEDAETSASPTVRTFVTISSPLGGMVSAGKGVEKSPVVLRSWYGLAPGSEFLDGLFYADPASKTRRRTLPPYTPWHMMFGYRGGGPGGSGDGAVALSSQLRTEAQEEARSVRGFDETHAGILDSPAAAAHLNHLLAAALGEP